MKKFILIPILLLFSLDLFSEVNPQDLGWRRLIPELTYEIAVDPVNPANMYAGGVGFRIFISRDSGKTWVRDSILMTQGRSNMNNMLVSRKDPNVILAGGIAMGNLFRSPDKGKTWEEVTSSTMNHCFLNGKALAEDAEEDGHFYLGNYNDRRIYESLDNGLTWDTLSIVYSPKIDSAGNFIPGTRNEQQPTCLAVRPDSSNILLCGNQGGLSMMSTDRGKSWTHFKLLKENISPKDVNIINDPTAMFDNEITMFAFNNEDPRKVYASITYTNYGNLPNGGIWRSTDGGYTWNMFAFPDSSFWGVATRTLESGEEEIFVGGYTADPSATDSVQVPGDKIVRGTFDSGKTWWTYDNKIDWVDPTPTYKSVNVRGRYIVVAGEQGIIQYSSNYGTNWSTAHILDYSLDFFDAFYYKTNHFIASGKYGRIYANISDQLLFDTVNTNYNEDLYKITQTDDYTFYVVGSNGLVLQSKNSLKNWTKEEIATKDTLKGSSYTNDKLYICGHNGAFLVKDLLTNNWIEKKISDKNLYSISFSNPNFGMVCGEGGTILKSTDGGNSFEKLQIPYLDTLFGVKCRGENQAIVVGKNGIMLYTKDGGNTWVKQYNPIVQDLISVDFIDDDSALVVGSSSTIFKILLDSNYANVVSSNYGPVGNVWSLRYFGPKYKEKLYMATEAGLFVLEGLKSDVEEISKEDPKANLNYKIVNNELFISYKRFYENSRNLLNMRIIDINGGIIFEKSYPHAMFENIIDKIDIAYLPAGVYIIEYIEKDKRATKKFIKN